MQISVKHSNEPTPEPARGEAVLLIAPQPFFLNRGTPMNVRAVVETLASAGYQVDLLAFPYGEQIEIPGVRVLRCLGIPGIRDVPIGFSLSKLLLDVSIFFSALRLVLGKRYSILHGIEEGAFITGVLGLCTRTPYVFDMDSSMPQQLRDSKIPAANLLAWGAERLEHFFLPRAKAVLTVCTALSVKARAVSASVPLFQIEDFADEKLNATPADETVSALRQELELSANDTVILYTGNFERYQGIELLQRAFRIALTTLAAEPQSAEVANGLRLLLVGGGALESAAVTKQKKLAEELGIADRVLFTGNRPIEEMSSFMSLSDVLVSPRCEGENTPLKLYNYMASSRPVVATNIYSHTQVLNEETAFLGEPTPEGYGAALIAALDSSSGAQAQRVSRSQQAKALVEARYSRQSFENRLRDMYREITGAAH